MINIFTPQERPYNNITYIAIAISGNSSQRHVGLLFRTNISKDPRYLHLAFHYRLKCEDPSNEYWLDCPGFTEDEQLQLATWFKKIIKVNGEKIPYGISYSPDTYFDNNSGRYIESNDHCGLTCATFVMALFKDFGFSIINPDTWIARQNDQEWHCQIVKAMKHDQIKNPNLYSDDHINRQISLIGIAISFRPEEVAAAANIMQNVPATFEQIEPLGHDVLSKMGLS